MKNFKKSFLLLTTKSVAVCFICFFSTITFAQGDSCSVAIPMPISTSSSLSNLLQTTGEKWFVFIPQTPEIRIKLTNNSPIAGHIHDLLLMEGTCAQKYFVIGKSSGNETIHEIEAHDLIVGIPYYLVTMRERTNCPKCVTSGSVFDLYVQSTPSPIVTVNNNIVSINGVPSHKKGEIIIRINKTYLKMSAVDNLNQQDKPMTVFVQPAMIQSMANKIYNGDQIGLGQVHLKKIFPDMTSNDSISISRQGQQIRTPDFWETFILTLPDSMSVFKYSRLLDGMNGIRFAEPNFVASFSNVPDDFYYATNQSNLHPTLSYPNANINIESAWDLEVGQPYINIGVYDSGIEQGHSDLNVAGGFNFFSNAPLSSPYDNAGHGTSCAGIIAAKRNNSIGVSGIAGGDYLSSSQGCSLYDMHIFQSTFAPVSTIANAIRKGATSQSGGGYELHVMSNSYGVQGTKALHDAIEYADQNGVVFVASRGNYPQVSPIDKITYPACYSDNMVINVGASGTDGSWKTNGNGNPSDNVDNTFESLIKHDIDVIAPGTNAVVYTTENVVSTYKGFNGTSAACPHVAGVSGLMLSYINQASPSINNLAIEDVENILQISAIDKNATGYDDNSGSGLIDAAGALNSLRKPSYKIQHFGVGQNASSIVSLNVVNTNVKVTLADNYGTLAAGDYYADRVLATIILNYSFSSPNDQILNYWPRFSSTLGWSQSNPVQPENWCQMISVSNTQAVLQTYIYNFKYDQNGNLITDPWYPTQSAPKAALSIYTFDPTVTSIEEISTVSVSSVYPNPAISNASINISIKKDQEASVELYDPQGKLIKYIYKGNLSVGNHTYILETADLSEGMYFVRFTDASYTTGKRFLVLKK